MKPKTKLDTIQSQFYPSPIPTIYFFEIIIFKIIIFKTFSNLFFLQIKPTPRNSSSF
jgi:hypothetical protein